MHRKASLLNLFATVFVDLLGFGIVIPILPYYSSQYGAGAWELGWIMTIFSAMQFFCAPLWGRLSDRVGRKPVLLLSLLGSAGCFILLGMAQSLIWIVAARLFGGIFAATISTAYAYVADVTTEENRAKGMGVVGAAFGLGFVFGPVIGGILSKWGYSTPMFAAAGISLVNFAMALFFLAEPPVTAHQRSKNRSRRFQWTVWQAAFSSPLSAAGISLFFVFTFAVTQMEVSFALFLARKFAMGAAEAGILLGISGIVMAAVQGGGAGRLARRYNELQLIAGGAALCGLGLAGFVLAGTPLGLGLALSVLALGHGAAHPTLSSMTSKGAPENSRGAVLGVFHSASSLARVLGPPVAGALFDRISPSAPFAASAGLCGCVVAASVLLRSRPWAKALIRAH